jgi:hypothetical protein
VTTEEAVRKVLAGGMTKYRLSQDMGCAPILVNYWLYGTKMGYKYRDIFEHLYGITINDNSLDASRRNK